VEEEEKRKVTKKMKVDIEEVKRQIPGIKKLYKMKTCARERLHEDASKRLKASLSKSKIDVQELTLAQGMIWGAINQE
jgi:hypothetical protein